MTQGSACRATLGFETESLWDSPKIQSRILDCGGKRPSSVATLRRVDSTTPLSHARGFIFNPKISARLKAAVNRTQSRRFAQSIDARPSRSVWTAAASAPLFFQPRNTPSEKISSPVQIWFYSLPPNASTGSWPVQFLRGNYSPRRVCAGVFGDSFVKRELRGWHTPCVKPLNPVAFFLCRWSLQQQPTNRKFDEIESHDHNGRDGGHAGFKRWRPFCAGHWRQQQQ
jgi:hypothetical protein